MEDRVRCVACAGGRFLDDVGGPVAGRVRARRWQRLTVLAFPSAMPHIAVALRLAAAHSVLAAVVAEFLMGTSGLGYLFRQSIVDMRTEFAFGCSVVATVISVAMFLAAGAAEKAIRDRWT